MPLALAPWFGCILGLMFVVIGRDEIRRSSVAVSETRTFLLLLLITLFLWIPLLTYFVIFFGDWAYSYVLPSRRIPSAVELLLIAAISSLNLLSFLWGAQALRRHAARHVLRAGIAFVLLTATVAVLIGPRMAIVSSFTNFREGFELIPLHQSPIAISLLWLNGVLLFGVTGVSIAIRRWAKA